MIRKSGNQPENNRVEDPVDEDDSKPNRAAHLAKYKWKKGESGNPSGRPRGSISITKQIKQIMKSGMFDTDVVQALAMSAIEHAIKGDHRYFREIIDRVDGKVPDIISGDGKLVVKVEYVKQPKLTTDQDDDANANTPKTE